MPRVRLTKPAYKNFDGTMGAIRFTQGVSEEISMPDAERIGSITSVEILDENGNGTGKSPSVTQKMIDARKAPGIEPRIRSRSLGDNSDTSTAQSAADRSQSATDASASTPDTEQTHKLAKDLSQMPFDYTEQTLADIADSEGINGLRKIANEYDVRGNSIRGIISDLMARKREYEKAKEN